MKLVSWNVNGIRAVINKADKFFAMLVEDRGCLFNCFVVLFKALLDVLQRVFVIVVELVVFGAKFRFKLFFCASVKSLVSFQTACGFFS